MVHAGPPVNLAVHEPAMGQATGKRSGLRGPPPQGPSIAVRGTKGSRQHHVQANLTEIRRMISALTHRENRIAAAEKKLAEIKSKAAISEIEEVEARLDNAKKWRDFTSQRLKKYLDYAIKTTPFQEARCECRPMSESVADPKCLKCKGLGTIKKEKKSYYAKSSAETLKYLHKVLPAIELCAKIRARTSEADESFKKLLEQHQGIIKKFGNAAQTGMEGEDAEQGAVIGIFDAAVRFDPVKSDKYVCPNCKHKEPMPKTGPFAGGRSCPKCGVPRMMLDVKNATFQTYAWNWSFRNSRARKKTDERPGLKPSIDDPNFAKLDDEGGMSSQVTKSASGPATIGERADDSSSLAALDLHNQIESLGGQQREVLKLILQNYSAAEIAAQLGLPLKEVNKVKEQAFEILREKMADYCV